VFAAVDDIAGEAAEAKGEFAAEVKKSAYNDQQATKNKESAPEFAEGIHEKEFRRNEVKK
jgi:hypothetical protein